MLFRSVQTHDKEDLFFAVCMHTAKTNFFLILANDKSSLPCANTRQRINLCRAQTHGKDRPLRLRPHFRFVDTRPFSLPCVVLYRVLFTVFTVCLSLPCVLFVTKPCVILYRVRHTVKIHITVCPIFSTRQRPRAHGKVVLSRSAAILGDASQSRKYARRRKHI